MTQRGCTVPFAFLPLQKGFEGNEIEARVKKGGGHPLAGMAPF